MRRREELAAGLRTVRERIEKACSATGRDPSEITLVAVTKYFPASDIDLLTELGVRAIGENRDQEASAKLRDVAHRSEIEVHFVGQLQSRKAGHVAAYADVVQSVDRPKLVDALARATERHGRHLGVPRPGNRGPGPPGRGGARPAHHPPHPPPVAPPGPRTPPAPPGGPAPRPSAPPTPRDAGERGRPTSRHSPKRSSPLRASTSGA